MNARSFSPEKQSRYVDACALGMLAGYIALASYSRGVAGQPEFLTYFGVLVGISVPSILAMVLVWRGQIEISPARLLLWAMLFRACGLFGEPLFEDDHFRYLWDGFQFAATGSPYGDSPAVAFGEPSVPIAMQRVLDQVNYPDIPTIYGPTNQIVFLLSYLLAEAKLWPLQLVVCVADLALVALLTTVAKSKHVMLYAWCPLVVKEVAFTTHPEVIGVLLLVSACILKESGRFYLAAVALGAAVCAKVFALLLVPFVLVNTNVRTVLLFVVTVVVMYLPFVLQGSTDWEGLLAFARGWEFNAAVYGAVSAVFSPTVSKVVLAGVFLAGLSAYWLHYRKRGGIPRGDLVFGAFLCLAPVINPWYALWFLAFAVRHPSLWSLVTPYALLLAYFTHLNLGLVELDPYAHPMWVQPVEFGLIGCAVLFDVYKGLRLRYADR